MPSIKVRRIDFYASDWLEGTIALTHVERSVYITICASIYAIGGPVELEHVHKFCPGHGFKRAVEGLVRKRKVTLTGTEVDSQRCASELARARQRTDSALANGMKGGRPSGLQKPGGFENQKPINHQSSTTIQQPSKKNARESALPAAPFEKDFEDWWEVNRHKIGKGAALKAYQKARRKGVPQETLIAGMERYVAAKPEDRPWCNPATWLNQERWTDEPDISANGKCLPFADGPTGPPPALGEYFDRN